MAASQLWYIPHRPDLVLLSPCDEEGPLPCPGSMFVSVNHLHPERPETKWRHPRSTPFLTCYGDLATQQPRVVRCACGAKPCKLRAVQEGGGVPDELIPADWATQFEPPGKDPAKYGPEGRRTTALQLYLECTGKAEKELPAEEGEAQASEDKIKEAAETMLTDYLKGRVCFQCNLPSSRMQKCGRCQQARYCSKDCQRADWGAHKPLCAAMTAAAAAATAAPAAAGGADVGVVESAAAKQEQAQAAVVDSTETAPASEGQAIAMEVAKPAPGKTDAGGADS